MLSKRITLFEAITWLTGDERRAPDAERAAFDAAMRELGLLVEASRPVWPQCAHRTVVGAPGAVSVLRYCLPSLLLEQLGPVHSDWPAPVRALADAAARQASYWSKRLQDQEALLQELLREARATKISIYGKRHKGMGYVALSPDDLRGPRRFSDDFQDLIYDRDTALRRFGEADKDAAVFFDVQVSEADVQKLIHGADVRPGPRSREPEPPLEVVVAWIKTQPEFIELSRAGPKGYAKQEHELIRAFPGVTNPKATLEAANKAFSYRKRRGRPKKEAPTRPVKR